MISRPNVTMTIVRGQTVKRVIDLAHDLMHEEEATDCDPRPLLFGATATNELIPVLRHIQDGEQRAKAVARVAMAMNLASEVEIEQIIAELGDALPAELRESVKQTLH